MLAAALLVVGSGCGDNVPLPGQPVVLVELGEQAREAVCDWAVRCRHVPDRSSCERLIDPKDYDIRRAVDAVGAGRLAYDAELGGACVDANRNQACLAGPWASDYCRDMFTGLVAAGDGCTSSFECPRGSVCQQLECSGQCCAGVCGPVLPVEEPPRLAIGERCQSHFDCDFDGYCSAEGRCLGLPTEEGEACLFGCGFGDLFCDLDELVCKRYGRDGEACDPDGLDAVPCDEAWSYCDTVCRPRPGVGEPCDPDGPKRCVPTAFCHDGACVARGQPGSPCTSGDECTVACDSESGLCLAYQACQLGP
ncbi:MAG: hypothetical protein KJO07_04235 [Deltaproteobacteria bacterium]|nr:hypothetical protein [Deltaproteobacteria bacterium]